MHFMKTYGGSRIIAPFHWMFRMRGKCGTGRSDMLCFIGLQQNLTSVEEFETVAAVLTVHGEVLLHPRRVWKKSSDILKNSSTKTHIPKLVRVTGDRTS